MILGDVLRSIKEFKIYVSHIYMHYYIVLYMMICIIIYYMTY